MNSAHGNEQTRWLPPSNAKGVGEWKWVQQTSTGSKVSHLLLTLYTEGRRANASLGFHSTPRVMGGWHRAHTARLRSGSGLGKPLPATQCRGRGGHASVRERAPAGAASAFVSAAGVLKARGRKSGAAATATGAAAWGPKGRQGGGGIHSALGLF